MLITSSTVAWFVGYVTSLSTFLHSNISYHNLELGQAYVYEAVSCS